MEYKNNYIHSASGISKIGNKLHYTPEKNELQLASLIKEETFTLDVYSSENEYLQCEKWLEDMGSPLLLLKLNNSVSRKEFSDITEIIKKNTPISFMLLDDGSINDEFNNELKSIINYHKLKEQFNMLKTKYDPVSHVITSHVLISNDIYGKNIDKNDSQIYSKYNELVFSFNDVANTNKKPSKSIIDKINADVNENENKLGDIEWYSNDLSDNYSLLNQAFVVSDKLGMSDINSTFPFNNSVPDDDETEKKKDCYTVVFNTHGLFSFVIENPSETEQEILRKETFGFKQSISFYLYEQKVGFVSMMKQLFHNKFYRSEKDIDTQLNILKSLYEKMRDDEKIDKEIDLVNKYIKQTYRITKNVNEKIKASELFKQIEEYSNFVGADIELKTLRNRLPKYLLDMGLSKKRFSDGFYYYGLKYRVVDYRNWDKSESKYDLDSDDIIAVLERTRAEDMRNIVESYRS